MINYTNNKRADFGTLGDDATVNAVSDSSPSFPGEDQLLSDQTPTATVATAPTSSTKSGTAAAAPAASSSSGILGQLTGLASGGGCAGAGLCGGANAQNQAAAAKKDELAKQYPLIDCGPTPTQSCLAYNTAQKAKQDSAFASWQTAANATLAASMPAADKAKFAAVAALAAAMKAKHPEAGSMTMSQIYKLYPDDFDSAYAQIQKQYPFLQGIDPATALAMSPAISGMTLDQLLAQTSTMGGAPAITSSGSINPLILGGGALLAILAILKLRD